MNKENRESLSGTEKIIYDYILQVYRKEGYSPAVREICEKLRIRSTSTVHKYLTRLEEKGYIQRRIKNTRSSSHTIRICEEQKKKPAVSEAVPEGNTECADIYKNEALFEKLLSTKGTDHDLFQYATEQPSLIPLLGTVAAGQPILAEQNLEKYVTFSVNTRKYDASSLFALTIHGDSMIDIGILDGDTVIVAGTQTAQDGEVVVALIENEATCKRFFHDAAHGYRLQPENATMAPIFVKECKILGKVIASFRSY